MNTLELKQLVKADLDARNTDNEREMKENTSFICDF